MKNTKRRFEIFSFYDHSGISAHLEKMALEGWMIEKISNLGWIYRATEPKEVRFSVSYYPKASEFDPEPSEDQKTFHEFCAHTGWTLACSSAQMQIFYNEQEDPIPIETEPELELASIHGSAKKSFLPSYFILMLLGIMNGILFLTQLFADPLDLLSDPTRLFTGFTFVILFLLCSVEIICYFRWYKKAKALAASGEFLKAPNTTKFQKAILLAMLLALLYWGVNFILGGDRLRRWIGIIMCIYIPVLFLVVNGTKNYLKKKKVSKRVNFRITMIVDFIFAFALMGIIVFLILTASSRGFFAEREEETYEYGGMTWILHKDEMPLTIEDLDMKDFSHVDFNKYIREQRGDESLLLGKWTYTQRPRMDVENHGELPQMKYTLVLVKMPSLYEMCKNTFISDQTEDYTLFGRTYKQIDSSRWNAKEVYQLHDSEIGLLDTYLICYENLIVEITFPKEPTQEQITITAEKLTR